MTGWGSLLHLEGNVLISISLKTLQRPANDGGHVAKKKSSVRSIVDGGVCERFWSLRPSGGC
jgi:hypothetical protein